MESVRTHHENDRPALGQKLLNCGVHTTSGQTTRKMDEFDQANSGEKLTLNGETNIEETAESVYNL